MNTECSVKTYFRENPCHSVAIELTAALLVGCGCRQVRDRRLLLHALLLAVDGANLALHDVAELEHTLFLECPAGEFLTLRVLRREVDLDAVDHRIGSGLHCLRQAVLALLLTVHGGIERTQSVELHGLTLREQLGHAIDHLTQYQHTHLVVGNLAVTGHVLGESLQVKGFLTVYLGEVLAVGGGIIVLVLTKIDHHWNV